MKNLKDVKAELLANPGVRQAYDAKAPEFELARELIAARTKAGLTQGDVAARMGTTQSVVARIESGRGTPSMRKRPAVPSCFSITACHNRYVST